MVYPHADNIFFDLCFMGIKIKIVRSVAFRGIVLVDKLVDKAGVVVFTEFPLCNHYINLIITNYNRFLYRIKPCDFRKH